MPGPGFYETLEASFYDVNQWMAENRQQDWFSHRINVGDDENFFPFFTRGLSTLARGDISQQPAAWADINKAFDHVKGLIASHHPVMYLRLAGRAASFKHYPDSPICLEVCRLLLKHAHDLFRQLHPDCNLLRAIWNTQISLIRDRELQSTGSMEHSINVVIALCGMNCSGTKESIDIGSLCIERYVPSVLRGQGEDALRATLESTNGDLTPLGISLAQETRLALAELLIAQERLEEGQRFVEDALAFRDLDSYNTEGKLFWMAELEWRIAKRDASITLLEEALAVVDAAEQDEETWGRSIASESGVDSGFEMEGPISTMHVLGILAHRLSVMARHEYESAVRKRLSPMLTKVHKEFGCPLTLHLVPFDLEVEMDPEAVMMALTMS